MYHNIGAVAENSIKTSRVNLLSFCSTCTSTMTMKLKFYNTPTFNLNRRRSAWINFLTRVWLIRAALAFKSSSSAVSFSSLPLASSSSSYIRENPRRLLSKYLNSILWILMGKSGASKLSGCCYSRQYDGIFRRIERKKSLQIMIFNPITHLRDARIIRVFTFYVTCLEYL